MKTPALLAILLPISILSYAQSKKIASNFTLKGIVAGNVHRVILTYPDIPGQRHHYTVHVKNSHFVFKGYISNPVYADIMNDVNPPHPSNAIDFFLSPGNMTILLKRDHFDEVKITGSPTQDEWIDLQKSEEPVNRAKNAFYDKMFAIERAGNTPANHKIHQAMVAEIDKCQQQIDSLDYHYISTHPRSYVSAYLLSKFAWSDMRLDSIEMFYNKLSYLVKKSPSGKAIAEVIINRKAGSVGAIAQIPTGINLDGSRFNPNEFKIDNYALLYFWADWANDNGHLKDVYNKYRSKDLSVLAISMDPFKKMWRDSVRKAGLGIWHNVFYGLAGNLDTFYNISQLPPSLILLVNKNHEIIGRYRGNGCKWYKFDYKEGNLSDLDKKLAELYKK